MNAQAHTAAQTEHMSAQYDSIIAAQAPSYPNPEGKRAGAFTHHIEAHTHISACTDLRTSTFFVQGIGRAYTRSESCTTRT
jgi:hypothetical protein